jgi:hypothetical protein
MVFRYPVAFLYLIIEILDTYTIKLKYRKSFKKLEWICMVRFLLLPEGGIIKTKIKQDLE